MEITLTPEQEKLIKQQLASGKFTNTEEIITVALRILEQLEAESQQWLEQTQHEVTLAVEQLKQGEGIEISVALAKLRNNLRAEQEK